MTEPTKEPLVIFIGGLDATTNIPVDTISITLERGSVVGSTSFTIEDAASFGILRWQTVLIVSPDLQTQYFFGYVTDFSLNKRGISRDYDITCSSLEVRLQKSTLNGICTGTDTDIIGCMFSNSLPNLSNLFDFSGITDLRLDDFDFPLLDTNMMEGLEDLASKVGANYSWTPSEHTRVNFFANPNMNDNGSYLTGVLPSDSQLYSTYGGSWLSSNTQWVSNVGVGGSGGMEITLQSLDANEHGFVTVGDSTKHALKYSISDSDTKDYWVLISHYGINDGTPPNLVTVEYEALLYDDNGGFVKSLGVDPAGSLNSTAFEQGGSGQWNLSNESNIPTSGYVDFIMHTYETPAVGSASIVYYDRVIVEAFAYATPGTPTVDEYFDGEQKAASLTGETGWLGTARDSGSYLGDGQQMNWSDTPPDAPYDIDIGTSDFISDLELEDMALDGINTVVVTGANVYVDLDFEYPSNGVLTHFDLEEPIFSIEGGGLHPVIYKNTGTDVTPIWTIQTVAQRIGNTAGVGNDCTYDIETHWVEFGTAPANLTRGWRVLGRRKERIRAVVEDELQVASDGVQLVTAIYNETATTEADVYELGLAELGRRAGTRRITFTTLEPGLAPGQEIDITDSAQGISETMIISRVNKRYSLEAGTGGGFVKSDVEAGDRNPDLADIIAQNTRMATNRPPITADTAEKALTQLYDDDNLPLWDDDNALLYQSEDN